VDEKYVHKGIQDESMHDFNSLREPKGDVSLVDELYRQHSPAIFAFLRQHTTSREDAEDLLLEAFTAALEYLQLATLTEEKQLAWLWRVVRHKTIDSYRRTTRRPTLAIEHVEDQLFSDEKYSPEQNALRHDEYDHLLTVMEELTPLQRDILRLRFANDLRCGEIAQALNKKESAVRVLLMRTLRFLRSIYVNEQVQVEEGGLPHGKQ
jgi:RNA polymerase sigma factor (sigma-70 family)